MSYDKELDRIYCVMTSDPNVGRWFLNNAKAGYARFFEDYREICHKVIPMNNYDDPSRPLYYDGQMWTVSVGGPGNKFQVGTRYFKTSKEAKKWADNRDMIELHYLEEMINKWRETVTNYNNINISDKDNIF